MQMQRRWLGLAKAGRMRLTFQPMDVSVSPATTPSGYDRRSLFAPLAVAAVFILGLIRLIGFVQDNAVDLLFEDQWAFLTPMFKGEGPWASFEYQHGPHRLGLGGLIEWYLYHATGWDVRADAWAAIVVLAVAAFTAGLIALLLARVRGGRAIALSAGP